MGICWYCHWGWAKPVADIYTAAVEKLGGDSDPLHFGPSHIVWDDENFHSAEWCLEHFSDTASVYTDEALAVVRWSLEELAKLPLPVRCVEPEDYDDEHPEQFPPSAGVEMVEMD